ncbi:major facilitator superfamily multidrug-resistance, DHA1 sub-family [Mycena pura]|uniref:Major facilitator superfamily multidrug-resistance, DHA1 sub-family n=1 Tax=Mycena pura TaxID=153505 RepID=A0AAD6UJB4_9AGAR|nr:major facilitator superfamily multidrug-resistance, DHA1 sub-family [Mycena pura]
MHDDEAPAHSVQRDLAPVKRTPIPKFQLFVLLAIQFAEVMTALVIYPFVVQFVRDTGITGGDEAKTGFYAGLLESAFFMAESLTVFQFGRLSDIYGRRPVLLLGPLGLAMSMFGFGLSKTFWWLFILRCAQGAFNGNIGVAKTAMNEISDPTNVADIFSYLSMMWSMGATLSPFIGGTLSSPATKWPDTLGRFQLLHDYPYFLPCAVAGSTAFLSFVFGYLGLKETLPSAVARARKRKGGPATETDPLLSASSATAARHDPQEVRTVRELLTRPVCTALLCHGMLTFCDMTFSALLPLVCATPIELGGLGLEPQSIGLIMGLCGITNAIIQLLFGGRVIRHFGARRVFTAGFCALIFAFSMYPLRSILARRAGRVDGAVAAVLAAQLSSSCFMYFSYSATIMFTMESAPNKANVGGVNGLAQMVGTTLRAAAPSCASSLFALSVQHNLLGGYLVYLVLGAIALVAVRCSLLLPRRLRSEAEGS